MEKSLWSILCHVSENAPKHSTVDLKFSNWAWSVCVTFGLAQYVSKTGRIWNGSSDFDHNTIPNINGVNVYRTTPISPVKRFVWFVIQGWYRLYCRLTFICGNEGKRLPCKTRGKGYER